MVYFVVSGLAGICKSDVSCLNVSHFFIETLSYVTSEIQISTKNLTVKFYFLVITHISVQ